MSDQGFFETLLGNPFILFALLAGVFVVGGAVRQAYRKARARATLTPLMAAITEGRADEATALVAAGGVNDRNAVGDTALHLASQRGMLDVAGLLLEHGADVALRGDGGKTALMYAAASGNHPLVVLLLDRGSDPHAVDKRGDTALAYASRAGDTGVVRLLLDRGATPTDEALIESAAGNHADLVRLLVERGANVDARANSSMPSPLHHAITHGDRELVEFLLDRGADLDGQWWIGGLGMTPLTRARSQGAGRIVDVLKRAGARD